MTGIRARWAAVVAIGALALVPAAVTASPAAADAGTLVSADTYVDLTSQQLTDAGFPKKPNVTGWGGTASLPTNVAAQWQDVVLTGKAPAYAAVGQLLTMSRFRATDTNGSGTMQPLNITAVVQKDRSYTMHFQLGFPGTFGYAVGYSTTGTSPEFVGFQFQFTTTGDSVGAPGGSSTIVTLKGRKLAVAGFTRTPNVVGWGGTAAVSTNRAKAGAPVTVSGTAPAELVPGTILTLERFIPTDKKGSGHFEPVDSVHAAVAADGSFSLTFEVNLTGVFGYSLGAGLDEQWIGLEFQLKTN